MCWPTIQTSGTERASLQMEREWSVELKSSGSITDQGTMWRSTSAGWDSAHIAHLLVAYCAQLRFWTLLFSRKSSTVHAHLLWKST
jgi:hypothetical protein